MPRNRRLHIHGGIYHVISRGIEQRDIFRDDKDYRSFLNRLEKALTQTGCQCLAWALMPNHFHLLIRTGEKPLSNLMRKVMTGHAVYFNRKYNRRGYLFQNRYKSILCQENVYLLELVRYIHANPARAGIINTMEELDVFPWTGHSAVIGNIQRKWQSVSPMLVFFSKKHKEALHKYRNFIQDGLKSEKRDDLMGGGLIRSAGGWEAVKTLKKSSERWKGDERILGEGNFVKHALKISEEEYKRSEKLKREGWNLEKLSKKICKHYKITVGELKRQGKGKRGEARGVLCYIGNKILGITGEKLAEFLEITRSGVSRNVARGECVFKNNPSKKNQIINNVPH